MGIFGKIWRATGGKVVRAVGKVARSVGRGVGKAWGAVKSAGKWVGRAVGNAGRWVAGAAGWLINALHDVEGFILNTIDKIPVVGPAVRKAYDAVLNIKIPGIGASLGDIKDAALLKIRAVAVLARTIADLGDVVSGKEKLSLDRIAKYAQQAIQHVPQMRNASVITSAILPKLDQLTANNIKSVLKNAAKRHIQKMAATASQAPTVASEK